MSVILRRTSIKREQIVFKIVQHTQVTFRFDQIPICVTVNQAYDPISPLQPALPVLLSGSNNNCKHFNRTTNRLLVTSFGELWHEHEGPLPVVVGYNGSQRSDAYSVAHQVDFLTQEVFNPATRKNSRIRTVCHRRDAPGMKTDLLAVGLTFHSAAAQPRR